jgi:hypothetical protein
VLFAAIVVAVHVTHAHRHRNTSPPAARLRLIR